MSLNKLLQELGYVFDDISLLEMALTHRSLGAMNNERLEFLGDAVLNFCIGEKLFHHYPDLTEGGLSRLRANLVNGDTLAEIGRNLHLQNYLRLGAGEVKMGGVLRKSILANALEAVIGAIYLDAGINVCQQRIESWFATHLIAQAADGIRKDPKTCLQECLQAKKLPLPYYKVVSVTGKEHNQLFRIECRVIGLSHLAVGSGTSRRRAEQDAAQKFLDLL